MRFTATVRLAGTGSVHTSSVRGRVLNWGAEIDFYSAADDRDGLSPYVAPVSNPNAHLRTNLKFGEHRLVQRSEHLDTFLHVLLNGFLQ
jgi:hypothetical protein